MHHFVAIGEFKLELKSGNAQSRSNSTIFSAVWPWNLADDLEQGKSEGFDSCDLPGNLAQILSKSSIFQPVWPWNFMHDLKQGKSEGFERPKACTGQRSLSRSFENKWAIPGNTRGLGISSGRWFFGMNLGTIRIEACPAPESKVLNSRLCGARERATSSEPQAPVAKAIRKAVL